mmetsp:Transcript_24328/g.54166  ORF Transcript_24328/g.54166 Transcript_24328/m.54166 type:complete len:775 (+) Transcript_24328:32-2356(+)
MDSSASEQDDDARGSDSGSSGGRALGNQRSGLGGLGMRKRRLQTDDNILGVFAEASEDRPAKGRGRRDSKASRQSLSFVRGPTLDKTGSAGSRSLPESGEKDAKSDSDGEIDPRFVFKGAEPLQHGPELPATNQLSFGQMANNYGKGFEMLKKMGFQGGGLGKRSTGIANPIEVTKRKDKQGLQDEGELVNQDLYGKENVGGRRSVEELLSVKISKEKPSEGWKKGAVAKRPRVSYKSAAEVAGTPLPVRIVDMRGPSVHVATSFSELASHIAGESIQSLKELRHNVRLLVAKYEDQMRLLSEKRRHVEDLLLSASQEAKQVEASVLVRADLGHCRQVVEQMEKLRERQDQGRISVAELTTALVRIQKERPEEFKALHGVEVAVALAVPLAKGELATWHPLQDPAPGLAILRQWKEFVEGKEAVSAQLFDVVLLPRLRSALCDWSVRDFEPCIRLVERCRDSLPKDAMESLLTQLVLPRLQAEVEAWDPRIDKVPIHLWIHPWLEILGSKLNCLWAPIRFKLSSSLDRWNPNDVSAHDMLKPWRLVLGPSHWEPLVEKVLSRLERAIAEMPVRPDGQDVGPISNLLLWIDVASLESVARVLETALFPPWHAALRSWLRTPGCDFEEVLQWYQGWRSLLPEALREQGSVQRQLAHGLEVMKQFMSHGEIDPSETPHRAPAESRVPEAQAKTYAPVLEEVNLSLSDYLAEVAGEQGLVFRPRAQQQHLGKQVYQLGSVSICLDKHVVYVAPRRGGLEWRAVSFDEVLRLAKVPARP